MHTILLTGFGPSPQHLLPHALHTLHARRLHHATIHTLLLPDTLPPALELLAHTLTQLAPTAALVCATSPHAPADLQVELSATHQRPLDPLGPPVVYGSLPVNSIRKTCLRHNLRTALSAHAGPGLGNAVFYYVARRVRPAGFIHVPARDPRPEHVRRTAHTLELTLDTLAAQLPEPSHLTA